MQTSANDCNSILRNAARILGLEIVSFCDDLNNKSQPRYFHANAKSKDEPSTLWRLKAVNPNRMDKVGIQDCNSYSNCVHARLAKLSNFQEFVTIPAYFDIPHQYLDNLSCSELIECRQPELVDISVLVALLIRLHQHRQSILHQLWQYRALVPRGVNVYTPADYRDHRFIYSVQSLEGKALLTRAEARGSILSFDKAMPSSIRDSELCFAHGDFSFGNLRITDDFVAMFDFEHSHIGIGLIDLAHLYVNLMADAQNEKAVLLLNSYRQNAANLKIPYSDSLFHALTLERVAGKLNSMKDTTGERWELLKALLLYKIT